MFFVFLSGSCSYLSWAPARRQRPITATQSSPHLSQRFHPFPPFPQPERSLLAGGVLGEVAQTTHRHSGVSCALVGVGWRNGTGGCSWRACPDIHGQRASAVHRQLTSADKSQPTKGIRHSQGIVDPHPGRFPRDGGIFS